MADAADIRPHADGCTPLRSPPPLPGFPSHPPRCAPPRPAATACAVRGTHPSGACRPMFINSRSVTVEWGDCDPAGIVFYPRYFAMFDASTGALFAAALGMTKFQMLRHFGVVGFPMVDTRASFRVPSRFGDVIRIETQATALRRSSFDVTHRILRGDTLAAEGFETRVWVGQHPDDPDRIKAVPLPPELIARLTGGPIKP